jgi:hypothetical protein
MRTKATRKMAEIIVWITGEFLFLITAVDEKSSIVSVSWSPLGSRRALLVARKDAPNTVWFQVNITSRSYVRC